jgi:hypothetical protein
MRTRSFIPAKCAGSDFFTYFEALLFESIVLRPFLVLKCLNAEHPWRLIGASWIISRRPAEKLTFYAPPFRILATP